MAEKRKKIFEMAEIAFRDKGLSGATISEIARMAGVAESVIYQYFKGKQDLLFTITAERMKDVLALINEQLQGIPQAESRLSKMVWWHLRYNDLHPGYSRILLLECRSNNDFYETEAYQYIRKYAGVMLGILKQGVKDGEFRDDIDMRIVREIILGTLDFETIGVIATGETKESASDLEDMMALIHAMIAKRNNFKEKVVSKEERILVAAEKVFAEKGFFRSKMADIAALADVAEGTVYEYFQNKEDLLLSLPIRRIRTDLDALPEMFHIKNPLRKLRRFIRYYFSLSLSERDFLKVFLLSIQLNKQFYGSKAFESFRNYFKVIEDIIEEGKREESFRPDVNPRVFRNMFLGAFSHLGLRWLILKKGKDKMFEIDQITKLLSLAVTADASQEATT